MAEEKKEVQEQQSVNMPTREEIEAVLDEIRPALRFDGGDVELVDVQEDGTVLVRGLLWMWNVRSYLEGGN